MEVLNTHFQTLMTQYTSIYDCLLNMYTNNDTEIDEEVES